MSDQHREMFVNRLRKNARTVGRRARRAELECYRLYDRDIPEIPVAVDVYKTSALVHDFRREDEYDEAWIQGIVEATASQVGGEVYLRRRRRAKGGEQYEPDDRTGDEMVVSENGLRFVVRLGRYVDTGLFPDHRPLRQRVREESDGRRVLNLFAYTGAFTVYAAAGGAAMTTTVDLSRTYVEWAARNLAENGLLGANHELVRESVDVFLSNAAASGRLWDLIVVDPPTFSNSAKMQRHFDVQRDYEVLLRDVAKVCAPRGVVYFSTNYRRFVFNAELGDVFDVENITESTIPFDYRHGRVHRAWRLVRH